MLIETDNGASAEAKRGNHLFSGAGEINQLIDLVPGFRGKKGNSLLFQILPANRLVDKTHESAHLPNMWQCSGFELRFC